MEKSKLAAQDSEIQLPSRKLALYNSIHGEEKILHHSDSLLTTVINLAVQEYRKGNVNEGLRRLDEGICQVDPTQYSKNLTEALTLVNLILKESDSTVMSELQYKRYLKIWVQQIQSLNETPWRKIRIEGQLKRLDFLTRKNEELRETINRQRFRIMVFLAYSLIILIVALLYIREVWRCDRRLKQRHDNFLKGMLAGYDQQALDLLLQVVEKEETITRLRNLPLDDEDQ